MTELHPTAKALVKAERDYDAGKRRLNALKKERDAAKRAWRVAIAAADPERSHVDVANEFNAPESTVRYLRRKAQQS